MLRKKVDYIFLFYIILSSGMATTYFRSVTNTLVLFVISAIYIFSNVKNINKNYIVACFLWFTYIILSLLKYQGDNYYWPFTYFVNFTIIYFVINKYKSGLFSKSEEIIFILTLLSLIFYAWQIIDFDSLLLIWQKFDISGGLFAKENLHYHHTLFYTILQFEYMKNVGNISRNAGFCWEPGAFSCFIIIAILFLIFQNNDDIKKRKLKFIIYLIALITTQSTTGFLAFFLITILFISNNIKIKKIKYFIFPIIFIILFIIYLNVPILGEKINKQINRDLLNEALEASTSKYSVSLDRFASLKITLLEFIDNPILGIGANENLRWSSLNNINISPTSGIGNILARYGLFGILPFFIALIYSSKRIATSINYKGDWYFMLIILIFGFSFNIIETPFFLSLIFFGLFNNEHSFKFSKK